jgi:hypothetical protein
MLTSASCCRHVQQNSACSFSVRQDSDISTQGTAPVNVIDMSEEQINREDVIRRRHVLLRCADSSLNHVLMLVLTQFVCDRPKICYTFGQTLGSRVRIQLEAWISARFSSVFVLSCVCGGLATGLIPRPGSPTDCL